MSQTAHDYPDSYYAATAHKRQTAPALKGSHKYDICIVGGGFSGLASAIFLAKAGYKVALLEAHKIGWGASGRNGGQLLHGFGRGYKAIKKFYGAEKMKALLEMHETGVNIVQGWIKEYDIKCDLKATGGMSAAANKRQMAALTKDFEELSEEDSAHKCRLITKDQLHEYVGTDAYEGGFFDPDEFHIHPLNLALGEAEAFVKEGGTIYENSEVLEIVQGKQPQVKTALGDITCDILILAGNAYLGGLVPRIKSKIMPVSSQIITTAPLDDETAKRLLPTDSCICDCNFVLDYYRMTADKRLLFGGGAIYGGPDPQNIRERLHPKMLQLFPYLKDVKIDYSWSGMIAITYTRMPHIGRIDDNIYYSQGYSGHGLNTTHLVAKIISDAIQAQTKDFDLMTSIKHLPFPGGDLLRVPMTNLGVLYYQMRDKLGL